MAQLLFSHGALVNSEGVTTPFHETAERGSTDMMQYLLERGADVHAVDGRGRTPLLRAADSVGNYDTTKIDILLDHGADVNVKDDMGQTALMLAARQNKTHVVRLLLENGAAVDMKDERSRTALIVAVESKRRPWSLKMTEELLQPLLNRGADVNAFGGRYGSALIAASFQGWAEAVSILIAKGADLDYRTEEYGTALDLSRAEKHTEVVKVLEEAAANRARQ